MKLISDIINELVDSDKSISSPLLKTKVLASRLNNQTLLSWVNKELSGYNSKDELLEYRIVGCLLMGTYLNGNTQFTNQTLPTYGLDENFEKTMKEMKFFQSVSGLESLLENKKTARLDYPFPAEVLGILQDNIEKKGNPYFQLISAKKTVSVGIVNEILSVVRNKLLDFMLQLDKEFGNLTEIEDLRMKREEISTIMNHTIINASGDGNIVNTGDNSEIKAKINITKGNKEELKKQLKKNGISSSDSQDLIEIIDLEKPNSTSKTFGKKVNEWTQKMIGKALDGTWSIGVGAAGNLLTEAIKMYYGL